MKYSRRNWLLVSVTFAGAAVLGTVLFVWAHQYRAPQEILGASQIPVGSVADDLSWRHVGGDAAQRRYSALGQITTRNVGALKLAWQYRTGELERRGNWARQGKAQATPILAAGHLVFCTPFNRIVALDPATGAERWTFDADVVLTARIPSEKYNCRGLAYWHDPRAHAKSTCAQRLFMATTDLRMFAIDAFDGRRCQGFGTDGQVVVEVQGNVRRGENLQFTSAPAVVGDVVVVGSASADNQRVDAPAGTVRAYDARDGRLRWTFEPIPRPPHALPATSWGDDSARATGQANAWRSITVDFERDIVFLPTSSPSPDFYGGLRPGDNRYANSIVALRGSTGEVLWHFQTVHHDLWDYDVPAGPTLFEFHRDGSTTPALVVATKTGFLFVLDRLTGQPLTTVEERPVPKSDVPGEWSSPTQPFSVGQPAITPQSVTPDEAFGMMIWDRIACARTIESAARNEGLFTPPSLGGGSLLVPFTGGGANWGGLAIDPRTNRVFINTSRAVHRVALFPRAELQARLDARRDGVEIAPMEGTPFGMSRQMLVSPLGMPCNRPPWGALTAVDLERGERAWEVVLGNTRKLAPLGMSFEFGTPNYGGPIVTAGGLVFIAATMDNLLRAFDAQTGALLWAGELPFGGQATPMTYSVDGRQFIVIVAGGHPTLGGQIGDAVVAFALH